jgi:hypothetical protein
MREIGRQGGLSRETAIRKEARADDELRESARQVLADALAGNKNIPKSALDAARSLFSCRSDAPPSQPTTGEYPARLASKGRVVTSLADVIDFATEHGALDSLAPAIDRAHATLEEQRAGPATLNERSSA